MRIIILSLTSLIILLVPQLAFASDEEGTVAWLKGRFNALIETNPLMIAQRQYITINLLDFDNYSILDSNVDAHIRVIDPNDDEMTYNVSMDDHGHARISFVLDDDAPVGHYSIDITADGDEYEEYWGGFEVVSN